MNNTRNNIIYASCLVISIGIFVTYANIRVAKEPKEASSITEAKEAVRETLLDPFSVKFDKVYEVPPTLVVGKFFC